MTDEVDEPELSEPELTGWDAIDQVLERVYGEVEPHQWGATPPESPGGADPLHGVSAFRSTRSQAHWHFVTYGFSELWAKESDDPALSGFGFELTFRLKIKEPAAGQKLAKPQNAEPPEWVDDFLRNLARYVFKTGNIFGPGDSMPLNGPLVTGVTTSITSVGFLPDPELGSIDTPNGRVEFLQVVGLTEDELEAVHCWDMLQFLKLLQGTAPVLITDLNRKSALLDPQFSRQVEQRTKTEGSSSDSSFSDQARFEVKRDDFTLIFSAAVAGDVARRLTGRTMFGRPFNVYTPKSTIRFELGQHLRCERTREGLTVRLTASHAKSLLTLLKPTPGTYETPDLPGLKIVIEPSK